MKEQESINSKNSDAKSPFKIDPSILPKIDQQGNVVKEEIVKPFEYTGLAIPPGNKQ